MLSARLASVRRVPTLAPRFVRHYAEYNEGATAKSKEFSYVNYLERVYRRFTDYALLLGSGSRQQKVWANF